MSRARLLLSESWQSIRQNLSTTVAATVTVLIGMCLLGLFIAFGTWVLSYSDHVQRELQVEVYFCTKVLPVPGCHDSGATDAQEQAVGQQLRQLGLVKSVKFVSKEEGLAQYRKDNPGEFGSAYDLLPGNPLPDAWVVTPAHPKDTSTLGKAICRAHYPGVEPCPNLSSKDLGNAGGVHWAPADSGRILKVGKIVSLIFLIAVVLLIIASTLLIANTIRLSIFSRRREIEVMKLVGATNWFIRGPFMLEGLLTGLAGSVLAVLLLLLGKVLLLSTILGHISTSGMPDVHALSFSLNALALIAAGVMLGVAGSGLTIRRFLQV